MGEPREQEQSIKDRKKLLYEDDPAPVFTGTDGDLKPFKLYLRDTPAEPLSGWVKAALWGAGILAALLLGAAAWKLSLPKPKPTPAKKAALAPNRSTVAQGI